MILLLMYQGKFVEAAAWTERAIAHAGRPGLPSGLQANLGALLGVIHLRRGETENCLDCLGPSSCIFPLALRRPSTRRLRARARPFATSREYLKERPEDLGVRMAAERRVHDPGGVSRQGPRRVLDPARHRSARSSTSAGSRTWRQQVGLGVRGPNMAGGSVFDDFTGDGLPDIFTTSLDVDLGASLFVNRGDGTFEDRSSRAGLESQIYCGQLLRRPISTTTAGSTW